jgi:hypothetical protein
MPRGPTAALGAFAAMAVVTGAIAGSGNGVTLLEAAVGLALVATSFARPAIGALIALAGTASVVGYAQLPAVAVGGVQLRVTDILMLAAFAGALLQRSGKRLPSQAILALALMGAFMVLAGIATQNGLNLHRTNTALAAQSLRPFIYLGIAIVIVRVTIDDKTLINVLDASLVCASVVALVSCVATFVGPVADMVGELSPRAASQSGGENDYGALIRIRLPGLSLCYTLLLPAVALILLGPRRHRNYRCAAAVLMLAAIALSLNRNQLVGLLLGGIVAVAWAPASVRRMIAGRFVIATVACLILAVVGLSLLGAGGSLQKRYGALLNLPELTQSATLRDRAQENNLALQEIRQHPWFGLGPQANYGAYIGAVGSLAREPRLFVHNQYLQHALYFGIPAALCLFLVPLILGVSVRRHVGNDDATVLRRAVAAAATGSVAAVMLSSFVAIYYSLPSDLACLGLCFGLQLSMLSAATRSPSG